MNKVTVDFTKEVGKVKPMHAVNNGPLPARTSQVRSNMNAWIEAEIPYARNHDAAFNNIYGGDHTVDVMNIFRDFDKDPYDENSYDFIVTDNYLKTILNSGTKVFYRLGQKIDHRVKKYDSIPPKDFNKWAVICEHIIRHYNEGWANGFNWNIEHWEIWNEPDLDINEPVNKRCWAGTTEQFFDLYETAAKHLKKCFPHLKIGGPALASKLDWAEQFLKEMQKRNVPIDFFSWHIYCDTPEKVIAKSEQVRELLDNNGYTETESILNEWNYVKDWRDLFIYSIETIISMKGAAFTAACMLASQHSSIDMLMYYDARPCPFNGIFDYYTLRPLKGYYPFKMFTALYKLGESCECVTEGDGIYAVSAKDESGNSAVMLCHYTDDDTDTADKIIELDIEGGKAEYQMYLLDKDHSEQLMGNVSSKQTITLTPNSVVLLK